MQESSGRTRFLHAGRTVADRVLALGPDRLYDNVGGCVRADASTWVARSAERYVAWVRGDFDHLTGT